MLKMAEGMFKDIVLWKQLESYSIERASASNGGGNVHGYIEI